MVFVSSLSLVFPNRTFFLYADSKEEMQEWIDLLTWKLVRFHENAKVSVHFINKLGCTLYSFFLIVVV